MVLRRNILIFHQAALGDFIITWPLAMALARMFAQSRVIYVTAASKGELAGRVIGVESIDVERDWHQLYIDDAILSEANLKTLASAQTIVSFGSSPNDVWETNVKRLAPDAMLVRLRTKPVDDSPVSDDQLPAILQNHITNVLVNQLAEWPIIQAGTRQMLRSVVDRGLPNRAAVHSDLVVIHPGAGKPEKCWPIERFVELAEKLEKAGRTVHVLLGEAEVEIWSSGAIDEVSRFAEVRHPATYVDLLNEIEPAGNFVGNDSGPAHLAAMIGVPTVGLFATPPDRWKPIGPKVEILQGDSMSAIPTAKVFDAVMRMKR